MFIVRFKHHQLIPRPPWRDVSGMVEVHSWGAELPSNLWGKKKKIAKTQLPQINCEVERDWTDQDMVSSLLIVCIVTELLACCHGQC